MARQILISAILLLGLPALLAGCQAEATDPLPSWAEGAARQSLVAFVEKVTDPASPDFVPESERIAVFDNDGTLWAEHPMYVQLAFVLDRVKALAPEHPEWSEDPLLSAAVAGDLDKVFAEGEHGLLHLVMATHAGMTADEFTAQALAWLGKARHPRFDRPYTATVYQPMLEVLEYLRANGFQTWIVSGGGIDFMRPWTEEVYGIPPEQVIGSSLKTAFEMREDGPVIMRLPEIDFIDDKDTKPLGIQRHIGRRPIAAFGNSDGDLQMLQWTAAGDGPNFGMIIRHTDAEREYAYDRKSPIGRLDRALDEAPRHGWTVVDMKNDWLQVFP
jgi:phosphoglycolate phosphatase-like HAD superfamily hydrolase